ncbi:MFS transporter [Limosilactobacillus fermentum]|uniref:MFS transporter n=1 Tax=Limosilactobacillus fermentum TaxID=1613 RepID=UPI001EE7829B|nr:MFS transporter [Limosilactobacillus fermentum]
MLAGRARDAVGRKQLFEVGLVIFGLASLAVGLVQTAPLLIVGRAVQGISAAIIAPTSLAILMDTYQGRNLTKAIGYYGAMAGVGASLGLVLGGLFADLLTWRIGFYINVPIALVMLTIAVTKLPQTSRRAVKLELIPSLLSVAGSFLVVYGLVGNRYKVVSLVVGILLILVFVNTQRTAAQPLMPLRLFVSAQRSGAYLARFCFMMAMLPFWFLTSQAMQQFLGFSPLMAGIGFFPLTILNFIVAMRVADLTERFGNGPLLGIGMALTVIGLLIMALLSPANGYWLELGLPMLLIGFGQGLIMSPLTTAGVANTLPEDAGAASGLINTMHQIGSSVGLALIVGVTGGMTHGVASYRQSLLMSTICAAIALVIIVYVVIPGEQRENQLKLKH